MRLLIASHLFIHLMRWTWLYITISFILFALHKVNNEIYTETDFQRSRTMRILTFQRLNGAIIHLGSLSARRLFFLQLTQFFPRFLFRSLFNFRRPWKSKVLTFLCTCTCCVFSYRFHCAIRDPARGSVSLAFYGSKCIFWIRFFLFSWLY